MNAPIVLFTFARVNHTRLTIESLLKNDLASESDLIIFSDAAKTPEQASGVEDVRSFLKTIRGFRSVSIHYRIENYGLAKSIIEGVTEVLNTHSRVIVLEDDLVTSSHFLTYMNEALEIYKNDERVVSIHGYVYPVEENLPEAFFLPGADCWGWATWKRGWDIFNPNGQELLDQLEERKMISHFDYGNTYAYSSMLNGQILGRNDSWAIRWYASAYLSDKLTLYPGRSLVHNIGNDDSGTHCSSSDIFDSEISKIGINLKNVDVIANAAARASFERYFKKLNPGFIHRLIKLIKNYIS